MRPARLGKLLALVAPAILLFTWGPRDCATGPLLAELSTRAPALSSAVPLPFQAHLATWIEGGLPVAAVADLDGREFVILVGRGDERDAPLWSVAISPGEPIPSPDAPAPPVALGPAPR